MCENKMEAAAPETDRANGIGTIAAESDIVRQRKQEEEYFRARQKMEHDTNRRATALNLALTSMGQSGVGLFNDENPSAAAIVARAEAFDRFLEKGTI